MIIDTRTIENFLSDEEINEIELIHQKGFTDSLVDRNPLFNKIEGLDRTANYHYFDFYNLKGERIKEIILPKLQKHFHKDIYVNDCHILESFYPYNAHTDAGAEDANGDKYLDDGYVYAWTFIIPLDNYDSNTIIFKQSSTDCKVPAQWIEKYNPPVINSISNDIYNCYLKDAVHPEEVKYLSVEEIFPWKKGSISATSREKFHCSDYFISKNIKCKRAIIMWTSIFTG